MALWDIRVYQLATFLPYCLIESYKIGLLGGLGIQICLLITVLSEHARKELVRIISFHVLSNVKK